MSTTSLNSISTKSEKLLLPKVPHAVNCSLCGCNGASVRCVKCNSMAFCIGCDDVYHRHPKRRTHLRRAVALEFIKALEKSQIQQQNQTQLFNKTDNNNSNNELKNNNKSLYPWRLTRTIPRVPDTFWGQNGHPSKMPIPPPRRKKKTLSFDGIKDTFKKLVNPDQNKNHYNFQRENIIQKYQCEPVYATIKHNNKQNDNTTMKTEKKVIYGSKDNSAFRPLPPTPDQLYENMRKFSSPNSQDQLRKNKQFTSSTDLTETDREHPYEQIKESSLPRKNVFYQDMNMDQQQQEFMYLQNFHGPSQSLYPSVCGRQQMISPNMFSNHCNCHSQCQSPHMVPHKWCNQCMQLIDGYSYVYYDPNINSLSNSLEELRNFNKCDNFEMDNENNDLGIARHSRSLSLNEKKRIRKAKIKRSHSTFTMYDDNSNDDNQFNYGLQNHQYYMKEHNSNNKMINKKHSSPTPSMKSTKSSGHYKYSDISDSSSSSYSKENKNRSITNWICERTKVNLLENNDEEENEEIFDESGQWSCRFCTFLNGSDRNICEICCKTRLKVNQENIETRKVSLIKNNKTYGESVGEPSKEINTKLENELKEVDSEQREIVFNEFFIREQMEIEKELQRRKESELKIVEENKNSEVVMTNGVKMVELTSSTNNNLNVDTSTKMVAEKKEDQPEKYETINLNNKINEEIRCSLSEMSNNYKNDKDEIKNHEKIVTRIIEEKISEQIEKLKINTPTLLENHQTNANNMIPIDNSANIHTWLIQNQENNNNPLFSKYIINGYLPKQQQSEQAYQPLDASFNNFPFQTNKFFPQQPSLSMYQQQKYPLQQWQNNSPLNSLPPSNLYLNHNQRTLSNSSINSSASMFGGFDNNYVPSQNPTMSVTSCQHQNNSASGSIINRISSFDDLQSMSSVTSSSLFYPNHNIYQNQQKSQINSAQQMIQILREAEKKGYSADDLETAIQFSPYAPLKWLDENWKNLHEFVMNISNNQIFGLKQSNKNQNFAMITEKNAKDALELCKGNLWQSMNKCVPGHEENKSVETETMKGSSNKKLLSERISFNMKDSGLCSGRTNNDANFPEKDYEKQDKDYNKNQLNDVVQKEESIRDVINPKFIYSQRSKSSIGKFLQEPMDKNELLNFYLKKIKDSTNLDQLSQNELEALIFNWQYEKTVIDYEREQLRIAEKDKERLQKMINVQKRIGDYLSDGTTTEEELDREVAQVFQNKKPIPELGIDSDLTPTFTNEGDIFDIPGSSGVQIKTNDDNNQIKQRIESKLNELSMKSNAPRTFETICSKENFIPTQSIIPFGRSVEDATQINQLLKVGKDIPPISIFDQSEEHFTDTVPERPPTNHEPSEANNQKIAIIPFVKPIQAQISDTNNNSIESNQKIENSIQKLFTGFPTIPVVNIQTNKTNSPEMTMLQEKEKIITKNDLIIISSHIENISLPQPMFSGNLSHQRKIDSKKTSNENTKKPPACVDLKNQTNVNKEDSKKIEDNKMNSLSDQTFENQIIQNKLVISTSKSESSETSKDKISSKEDYSYDFQWARTELECELCTATIPVQDIIVMITCTHFACRECMKKYLTIQIRERQRLVITCPFCDQPDISADQDEQVFEYLGMFDPFVRHIIDLDVYELFQRKMRDRALMRDPNFIWCIKCSSGFIVPNPKALTVICPDCRCVFCRTCKKPWKKQHSNLSCDKYAEWEMLNDVNYAEQQLNKYLEEFGIECPNCHFRYQLAKGGCMHFRCTQCSYDFCGGCYRPFKLGSRCFRAKVCERLGLHAHHPRNCLFYLRDKDISDLQRLLDQHNIKYKTTIDSGQPITRCQVMEQKEIDFVTKDKPCNRYVEMAGLCKLHYKEYLGSLIYQNKIDPIHILNERELELTLKRENICIPSKIHGEDYKTKLIKLILEKIPLDLK